MIKLNKILNEIKRREMPQIDGNNLNIVIKIFQENEIPYEIIKVQCNKLIPTQEDFKSEKVENIKNAFKRGEKIYPIIISMDNFIIDGHHRFIAIKDLYDNNSKISCIKIGLNQKESLILYDRISDKLKKFFKN